MNKIQAAGGIVFKKIDNNIEIALIKDPYGKYTFPKGHIEFGEDSETAALREVSEEIGCSSVKLLCYIGDMIYSFKDNVGRDGQKNKLVVKQVYYYLMELLNNEKCTPQKEEGIEEVIWVDIADIYKKIGYNNIKSILDSAINKIKKQTI